MIGVMFRYNNEWGYMDDETFLELSPEEAGAKMVDFLKECTDPKEYTTKKGKKKTKDKNVLFVTDLDLIGSALHKEIIKSNFQDLTGKLDQRQSMPIMGYNYLIGSDMGKWFGFTVVNRHNAKNSIYALENVIPHLSINEILRERKNQESDLKTMCRVSLSIIKMLTDITGKESMTISSYALRRWTDFTNIYDQSVTYPDMYKVDCDLYGCSMDDFLRNAYKGGWCYLNASPLETYHNGITLDVNSLYPYVMKYKRYPIGYPKMFVGEIPEKYNNLLNKDLMIAFIHISCKFSIKDGFLPFVQIPGDFFRQGVLSESKIRTSKGQVLDKPVELTFTGFEFELFKKHYDIYELEFLDGCVFYTSKNVFKDYVDEYYTMKATARQNNDIIMESVGKHLLNNLSGILAKKKLKQNCTLNENGELDTIINCESAGKSLIQIASCITSYARCLMVETAQANYDRFLYCDTDSLHLIGREIPNSIQISKTEIGHFKIERYWKSARFFKQKVYIEEDDNEGFKVTYAGCPAEIQREIERKLNGQIKLAKYFEQTREEMHLDIGKIKIDGIPYECEISNGTFTPDKKVIPWKIDIPPEERKRQFKRKKLHIKNTDNFLKRLKALK